MIVHRADWVLPIARRPIRDGWVAVEGGRIAAVGGPGDEPPPGSPSRAATPEAILPGLVNAHTHLELSWMRGRIGPAPSMPQWAARLMALRRTVGLDAAGPVGEAVEAVRACGTALVGDISNTLAPYDMLRGSGLFAHVFFELLGFRPADVERTVADACRRIEALGSTPRVRTSLAPHAPYSVAPELFGAIARTASGCPLSVHLAESAEEIEFLQSGTGAWRELLDALGAWNPAWTPPGERPVEYLARLGLVNDRLLAVHCVQLDDRELHSLAEGGATVVTCPRSNLWTGAGLPPLARFYASGVRVAVGTDSLASVDDLNVFSELAVIRTAAPHVPAAHILESATRHGADALGFGAELGTIEPGKCAELIGVRVPAGVDVEEYLLRGIQPEQLRWLPSEAVNLER